MVSKDKTDMPGMVRASLGLYNTNEDVDALIEALHIIALGEYKGNYIQDVTSGEFFPQGWNLIFDKYYSIDKV
jgi:cysteine desulfurase / selenocysteine lyase